MDADGQDRTRLRRAAPRRDGAVRPAPTSRHARWLAAALLLLLVTAFALTAASVLTASR